MWLELDKLFYKFPNGRQKMDSISDLKDFNVRISGWNGEYIPNDQIKQITWHSYGVGTFWQPFSTYDPVYVSIPIYINTFKIEI